jgi:hypothetical protein
MNLDYLTSQMADNAERIRALVQGVSDEQARWKPSPDSWSILEVVNHLYDEEREDFRVRLDYILHRPGQPWPGIDPEGWVTERQYNQREVGESVNRFLDARQESLVWLRGLESPNWETVCDAPFGRVTAGDLFASWVAHDLLHMRQLVELHWFYTVNLLGQRKVDYAGTW